MLANGGTTINSRGDDEALGVMIFEVAQGRGIGSDR